MEQDRPPQAAVVVPFVPRPRVIGALDPADRAEIARLAGTAAMLGYRLDIQDAEPGNTAELGAFVLAYRRAEPFARWGFTRRDGAVLAWCARSFADVGRYVGFAEALLSVLPMPYA